MADRYSKHQPIAPGDYPLKFKEVADASAPDGVYVAPVMALEPGSIGGGGGPSSAVGILDSASARIDPALKGQFPSALVGGRLDVNVGNVVSVTVGNFPASQAVTNAGTFAVQASLAAETTKVIGTVNQGTSPWVTSRNWALTSADIVTAVQGTAAALAGAWPAKVTDGTNTMPTMDVVARAGFHQITNGTLAAAVIAPADAQAVQNGVYATAASMLWNGASMDRQRANFNTTTADTGAKTANFLGATQTNFNARGAIITILLGAVSGTFTTFQTGIQWSFDGGTTWLPLTPLGANITAPASGNTIVWNLYPGNAAAVPAASGGVAVPTQYNQAGIALPRTWRIAISIAGTTPSITITSVNVNYID